MYASQRDRNREREGESQRERKPGREREIERATDNRQQRFSLALSDSLWLYLALSGSCSCIQIPCLARSFSPALQHFILVCVEPHNLLSQYFEIVAQGTWCVSSRPVFHSPLSWSHYRPNLTGGRPSCHLPTTYCQASTSQPIQIIDPFLSHVHTYWRNVSHGLTGGGDLFGQNP